MTDAMIDLFDGKIAELEINEPCLLLAGRLTDTETGESWRYVYRSPLLQTSDPLHKRMVAWLDGAAPVGEIQVHQDDSMMFGTGELALFEP